MVTAAVSYILRVRDTFSDSPIEGAAFLTLLFVNVLLVVAFVVGIVGLAVVTSGLLPVVVFGVVVYLVFRFALGFMRDAS